MPRISALVLGLSLLSAPTALAQNVPQMSLMPLPSKLTLGNGRLPISPSFRILVEAPAHDAAVQSAALRLRRTLERASEHRVAIEKHAHSVTVSNGIIVRVGKIVPMTIGADESYSLQINSTFALLQAPTSLGALRGLATVRQLVAQGNGAYLPALQIEDAPLYPWRGLMIDCARHFIPIDVLDRTIDAMELVKLNVLHLHLSDDQGFRVESKVFPKLQELGSNGQFYTQSQIKHLIRYAALRGVLIVPEFDMPSHTKSWFVGYPQLSSSPGPFTLGPFHYRNIPPHATTAQMLAAVATAKVPAMNPTRESTYRFLDRFIGETTRLFPSPYFHIGADENNGAIWRANPSIVAFMKSHHMADTKALQSYFVERIDALVKKRGKTMVAWEEAYSPSSKLGGVYEIWLPAPMSKTDLLKAKLPANDRLLVSKGFYLDLFYPAYVYYKNDALPSSRPYNPALLGGEGAMWTELEGPSNIESRVWPRAGAIAERLWTSGDSADPASFYRRLFNLSALLDREGVHNLADYREGVARIAVTGPVGPVKHLLDVLTPLKGYKRLMAGGLQAAAMRSTQPLDQVADVVLVDSRTKYLFRSEVKSFLATHDRFSAQDIRIWLNVWAKNDALLEPKIAHSPALAAVAGHSRDLAALAKFALSVMPQLQNSQPLSADQLARADALLKAAGTPEGQTELCVVPEFASLLHGKLKPEPTSYPLF